MRLTKWENGVVYYFADGKKLRPIHMRGGEETEKVLRRLAELEDWLV